MAKNKKSPKMMKVVYFDETAATDYICLLYTSPSPRDTR